MIFAGITKCALNEVKVSHMYKGRGSMEEALKQLLIVEPTDVSGLLKEFTHSTISATVAGNPVGFHFMRFQNGKPRLRDLMAKLSDLLIAYCLPRERHKEHTIKTSRKLYKEARATFNKAKDQSKSGELGEMMVYLLVEGLIGAPQIVSKMALKTSGNMNVNGSDGIHLGLSNRNLTFYYGESKLYQSFKAAIESAIASVLDFNTKELKDENRTQHDFEANLVRNHLEIPSGPLRNLVLDMLDSYHEAHDDYKHVHVCFFGFNWDILQSKVDESSLTWSDAYRQLATDIVALLEDKLTDPNVADVNWHFFFLPFENVQVARDEFAKELNDNG